jgi:hypothetical protein
MLLRKWSEPPTEAIVITIHIITIVAPAFGVIDDIRISLNHVSGGYNLRCPITLGTRCGRFEQA